MPAADNDVFEFTLALILAFQRWKEQLLRTSFSRLTIGQSKDFQLKGIQAILRLPFGGRKRNKSII
jgi:hypothetical protein